MAKKKIVKKVYLPKWQRFFVPPLITFIWLLVTYQEFFNPENTDKMGTVGYLFMTLVLLFSGGMTFLMAYGKLPAYIIEEETKE